MASAPSHHPALGSLFVFGTRGHPSLSRSALNKNKTQNISTYKEWEVCPATFSIHHVTRTNPYTAPSLNAASAGELPTSQGAGEIQILLTPGNDGRLRAGFLQAARVEGR